MVRPLARHRDFDGFRHFHPDLAFQPGHGDIGRAQSGSQRPQRPVCAGMGIGPDDHLSGPDMVLHHELVADANAVIDMGQALLPGKSPHCVMSIGGID